MRAEEPGMHAVIFTHFERAQEAVMAMLRAEKYRVFQIGGKVKENRPKQAGAGALLGTGASQRKTSPQRCLGSK